MSVFNHNIRRLLHTNSIVIGGRTAYARLLLLGRVSCNCRCGWGAREGVSKRTKVRLLELCIDTSVLVVLKPSMGDWQIHPTAMSTRESCRGYCIGMRDRTDVDLLLVSFHDILMVLWNVWCSRCGDDTVGNRSRRRWSAVEVRCKCSQVQCGDQVSERKVDAPPKDALRSCLPDRSVRARMAVPPLGNRLVNCMGYATALK